MVDIKKTIFFLHSNRYCQNICYIRKEHNLPYYFNLIENIHIFLNQREKKDIGKNCPEMLPKNKVLSQLTISSSNPSPLPTNIFSFCNSESSPVQSSPVSPSFDNNCRSAGQPQAPDLNSAIHYTTVVLCNTLHYCSAVQYYSALQHHSEVQYSAVK